MEWAFVNKLVFEADLFNNTKINKINTELITVYESTIEVNMTL